MRFESSSCRWDAITSCGGCLKIEGELAKLAERVWAGPPSRTRFLGSSPMHAYQQRWLRAKDKVS
jgi:hypothetical protein